MESPLKKPKDDTADAGPVVAPAPEPAREPPAINTAGGPSVPLAVSQVATGFSPSLPMDIWRRIGQYLIDGILPYDDNVEVEYEDRAARDLMERVRTLMYLRQVCRVSAGAVHTLNRIRVRAPPQNRSLVDGTACQLLATKFDPNVLFELDIAASGISDVGVAALSGFVHLQRLDLSENHTITDAALAHLQHINGLRVLRLDHTRVGDAGLMHLGNMLGLFELGLGYTLVSDHGMVHLKNLVEMRVMNLEGTIVTGAGLMQLAGMAYMDRLDVEPELEKPKDKLSKEWALGRCAQHCTNIHTDACNEWWVARGDDDDDDEYDEYEDDDDEGYADGPAEF